MTRTEIISRTLGDLRRVQADLECVSGDKALWPDLEALLRLSVLEAARSYERETSPRFEVIHDA